MIARWVDTDGWSSQEWLAAVILVFILVTVGVVMLRLVRVFKLSRRNTRAPNLRPLRRTRARSASDDERE